MSGSKKEWAIWLIIFSSLVSACDTKDMSVESKPNIILILADDLGYETIGANGGASYKTPNIDKMAKEGMRFEHCYAQPLCTPSRVQIMTGVYNVRNYVDFGVLHPSLTTFGHLFQNAGYATCVVGKWQLGKDPMSPRHAGFDEHCLWQVREGRVDSTGRDTRFSKPVLETNGEIRTYDNDDYGPDIVSDYGLNFIRRSVESHKPFLLYYPMILTHCPFSPTPNSDEWVKDDTTVMKYKGQAHYFEDMVTYTDEIIGRITSTLDELGVSQNTLIFFTGDNGTDTPIVSDLAGRIVAGAKSKSTDGGTRVPLIAKWPGHIPAETTNSDLIDFSDILPTICDATAIRLSDTLQPDGVSFLPQLLGKKGDPRQWVYNWYSRNGSVEDARVFARNQKFKLYASGEFYEVSQDYLEENPIPLDSLSLSERETYTLLKQVIDHYESRRLEDIIPTEDRITR